MASKIVGWRVFRSPVIAGAVDVAAYCVPKAEARQLLDLLWAEGLAAWVRPVGDFKIRTDQKTTEISIRTTLGEAAQHAIRLRGKSGWAKISLGGRELWAL